MTTASQAKTSKAASKATKTMDEAVASATAQAEEMVSHFELPETVRDMAERGIEQTREAYGKMRDAAQQATTILEESTSKASETATAFNLKNVDYAEANVEAGFELARKLFETRDPAKAVELQLAFARKQTEAFNTHVKEMGAFATKNTPAMGEAFNNQFTKYFEQFRAGFTA
ncbi:MAG: hypothetical protein HKN60_02485 [Rhizobiales bacterium]|nr:hypothetical protein [Hyphomicrobiales bacterium]